MTKRAKKAKKQSGNVVIVTGNAGKKFNREMEKALAKRILKLSGYMKSK